LCVVRQRSLDGPIIILEES